MKLPRGLSQAAFDAAIARFSQVVGAEWTFTSEEDVELYRDAYSPFHGEDEELVASAALAPDSVEQVREIVRIANDHRVPLYPISTGRNLGYGGSAPTLSGSVVLDLRRMNRILEVNETNAYALVEPGVSYFDLYRHLRAHGHKLWIDTPDPGWGSLIGNAMDRGGGYTAASYRNHFDAHCGMELVLPNGELMRTGMGAMPNAQTWQQYKAGFGPWIDGMFSQSNFGICTKMGFWLMPEPEAYLAGTVSVRRFDDLMPLVDLVSHLENAGIVNGMPLFGCPLTNPTLVPAEEVRKPLDAEVAAVFGKPGGPSHADLEALCRQRGVGMWACRLQFYGPEEVIRAQWRHAQKKLAAIAGAWFTDDAYYDLPLTDAQADKSHKVTFGIPNLNIFFIGARSEHIPQPTQGHIWFAPIIPRSGAEIFKAQQVFEQAARELGLLAVPLSVAATYWNRAFIYIFGFAVTHDVEQNRRMRESYRKLVAIAAEHCWGEYRTAPAFQDAVMATYSFNEHALLRFHETIKDAIDPNGILAPGRYGIWPKHLRQQG
ncbi:MAG: FAD-binding oxidoreductase [Gammaproteobacteria bacterium]|nr:FAD-binding oxidoreductase [Gammaproteobacteria bacterium]